MAAHPVSPDGPGDAAESAGVVFVVLAAQFLTVTMLAAAIAPDYAFRTAAISDLGVIPETALLFNASLVLAGLLNVLGGYYLYTLHDTRWLLALFVLAGIGAIGAGLVPLDAGDLHGVFALLAFLFMNLEVVGTATRTRGGLRMLLAAAGVIGLVFVGVMILGDAGVAGVFDIIGHGGVERMIVYPVMFALLALGGGLLAPRAASLIE